MQSTKARARVQITIEVETTDAWGPDCSIGQLYKQAVVSARDRVFDAIRNDKGMKICGDIKVLGVLTEQI